MGKLLMIMQHIILYTSCIAFMLVPHACIFIIDHAEQGPEELPALAQVMGANSEEDQGKPGCI
jgi:hypothetical protein